MTADELQKYWIEKGIEKFGSQLGLAKSIEMPPQQISKYYRKKSQMTLKTLLKIINATGGRDDVLHA